MGRKHASEQSKKEMESAAPVVAKKYTDKKMMTKKDAFFILFVAF